MSIGNPYFFYEAEKRLDMEWALRCILEVRVRTCILPQWLAGGAKPSGTTAETAKKRYKGGMVVCNTGNWEKREFR